jgi:thiamine kinase
MAQKVPFTNPAGVIPAEHLQYVPGCEDGAAPLSVRPLTSGTTNRTFLVRTPRGSFVVRVQSSETRELGVDRQREMLAHRVAADAGLAPRIVAHDPTGACMVLEYIDGRQWTEQSFQRVRESKALAARLRLLQTLHVPASLPRFDAWRVIETYAEQVIAAQPESRSSIDRMKARAADAWTLSQSAKRAATLVHLDLNHTNLLVADRLYFLDWEYAHAGDPALDLATVLAYYPRAMTHAAMLAELSGLKALGVTPLMLSELTRVMELITYLWYRLPTNERAVPLEGFQTAQQIERRLLSGA